ncbi:MAG: hypothetical protein WKG07_42150 [Hymenobacter sp.]
MAGALLLAAGLGQRQDAVLRAGLWALVLAVGVGLPAQPHRRGRRPGCQGLCPA